MLNILTFTGEIDKKKTPYTELYNLLGTDGLKLSQEVMAAIIFRKTGKSTKTLTVFLNQKMSVALHSMYHTFYIRSTLTKHSFQNPVWVSQLREKILVLEMMWSD